MKTRYAVLLAFLMPFLNLKGQIPQFDWAQSFTTEGSAPQEVDVYPSDMCVDASGNSYHVGVYSQDVTLSNGQILSIGNYDEALYVMKYTADGNLAWAQSITQNFPGTSILGYGSSIAVDQDGSVYVAGHFNETALSVGILTMNGVNCATACEALFLTKLSAAGEPLWVKPILGEDFSFHSLGNIAADDQGNVYLTGSYDGTVLDFGNGQVFGNLAGNRFFIAKYNSQGNIAWVSLLSNNSAGSAFPIFIEWRNGRLACVGYYTGTIDFGNNVQLAPFGSSDYFVTLFQPNDGTPVWGRNLTSTDYLDVLDIDLDNEGSVYLATDWAVDLSAGTEELALTNDDYTSSLLRLQPNDVQVPVSIGYNGDSYPINTLAVDGAGNIAAGGYFDLPSVVVDDTTVSNGGGIEGLVFLINKDLDLEWARNFGGLNDQGLINLEYGKSMGFDNEGRLYFEGAYIGGLTADGITLTGDGLFVARMNTSSVSVNDPVVYGGFGIYPNPTSGAFTLQFDEVLASEVQMVLIDQQGREVYRQTVIGNKQAINTALLPGIYTVKVMSDRGVMLQKLVKTH